MNWEQYRRRWAIAVSGALSSGLIPGVSLGSYTRITATLAIVVVIQAMCSMAKCMTHAAN